jgi:CheY-like chemotaxis protein
MVIDDDAGMRTTLTYILEDRGYDVLAGADGSDAIETAVLGAADVYVMDVKMAQVDGIEACRSIRQHQPDAAVLLITAYVSAQAEAKAEEAGARALLYKPLNVPELLERLGEFRPPRALAI